MQLRALAFDVAMAPPWEARIYRRVAAEVAEPTAPVVHLANFPLPRERGDFGSGVTETMRGGDVFVSLFEYGPESLGRGLFAHEGRPTLRAGDFAPSRLQRTLPGHTGCQTFFTEAGRPFCLYVVIADRARLAAVLPAVNAAIAGIHIEHA